MMTKNAGKRKTIGYVSADNENDIKKNYRPPHGLKVLCKDPRNKTGMCNEESCPTALSKYIN